MWNSWGIFKYIFGILYVFGADILCQVFSGHPVWCWCKTRSTGWFSQSWERYSSFLPCTYSGIFSGNAWLPSFVGVQRLQLTLRSSRKLYQVFLIYSSSPYQQIQLSSTRLCVTCTLLSYTPSINYSTYRHFGLPLSPSLAIQHPSTGTKHCVGSKSLTIQHVRMLWHSIFVILFHLFCLLLPVTIR